jgi:acyl-CoA thioesterase-2
MNQLNPAAMDLPAIMSVVDTDERDVFVGQPETYGSMGIFGGHFLGQALNACFATVEETKFAQSLHAYFLNPGNPEANINYRVHRLKEGRGTDIRSVTAEQNGRAVFQMMASFKFHEVGDEHQKPMPDVISAQAALKKAEQEGKNFSPPLMVADRATLVLISDHFIPEAFVKGRAAEIQLWMKSNHDQSLSEREHQSLLAFLSDGPLMFNSALPHGVPFTTHRMTSLDHSVWFHRPCDTSQWLLYDQRSEAAADGRGLNEGEIFDTEGNLVMTCMQESMLRRM